MSYKIVTRFLNLLFLPVLLFCSSLTVFADDDSHTDLENHRAGIWSIADAGEVKRWVVIHDVDRSGESGIYHIEVIGLRQGDPSWRIKRLIKHMAITADALRRSIITPLERGAVYPEQFNDAYRVWRNSNGGSGGEVCEELIVECME